MVTPCSVRRRETRKDSQRNHHSSDARLKLRVFRFICNSLSRPCCCRPSCPCCTPACTATALPLSRCFRCHGVSARNSTLKRSSLCSALHTPGTPAHSVSSRCDSRREIVRIRFCARCMRVLAIGSWAPLRKLPRIPACPVGTSPFLKLPNCESPSKLGGLEWAENTISPDSAP